MIIDFHTHIFSPRMKEERAKYINADPFFASLYSPESSKLATADDLIDSMDSHGVDISVVLNIAWMSHELCVESNDYIMESIARYPRRLVGFCALQMLSAQLAVDEIERCVKGGMRGVGELRPDRQLVGLEEVRAISPILETIKRQNLILLLHASEPVGHEYQGKGTITPEILYPFIAANPDITMVLAHWGGGLPFYALMPEVKKALRNVYFDTAASPYLYNPQVYKQVEQLVGRDKILFGTDYPLLEQNRLISEVNSSDFPEETQELILGGNARRLLGLTD